MEREAVGFSCMNAQHSYDLFSMRPFICSLSAFMSFLHNFSYSPQYYGLYICNTIVRKATDPLKSPPVVISSHDALDFPQLKTEAIRTVFFVAS